MDPTAFGGLKKSASSTVALVIAVIIALAVGPARAAGGLEISPHAYARFDAIGNVAASINAQKFAEAYRTLHPLLESAFHQLSNPDRSFDAVTARALQRICDAPLRDRPPRLEHAARLYIFAEASLESLGPVEKALLRMGPRNTHLIQQAARDIGTALGLQLRNPPQAAQ